jgi:hypothetical protein
MGLFSGTILTCDDCGGEQPNSVIREPSIGTKIEAFLADKAKRTGWKIVGRDCFGNLWRCSSCVKADREESEKADERRNTHHLREIAQEAAKPAGPTIRATFGITGAHLE